MKKILAFLFIIICFFDYCISDNNLKRSILPIVKITNYTDINGLRYKIPTGTALLVKDEFRYPGRLFLITAKHVIEKDSATDCMINFSKENDQKRDIVSSVKKYTIYKNEWKYHNNDKVILSNTDTTFFTYDIAIAEIFLQRVKIDDETLWHNPLDLNQFSSEINKNDTVKILAFPFVNQFNWERGLTLGDIEQDLGLLQNNSNTIIKFVKNKNVYDLGKILIENPKFRPGYSGGLVFYEKSHYLKFLGISMGMTNIIKNKGRSYCFSFYIKAENIKDAIYNNFK